MNGTAMPMYTLRIHMENSSPTAENWHVKGHTLPVNMIMEIKYYEY